MFERVCRIRIGIPISVCYYVINYSSLQPFTYIYLLRLLISVIAVTKMIVYTTIDERSSTAQRCHKI